jgi:hypothetical protein
MRVTRTKWSGILQTTGNVTRAFRAVAVCGRPGGHAPGVGSVGGVRVIYYFAAPEAIYFISVYAKNEKENLSDAEKQALSKILRPFKQREHEARPQVGRVSQRNRKTHEG